VLNWPRIAKLIDSGELKLTIDRILPLFGKCAEHTSSVKAVTRAAKIVLRGEGGKKS